MKRILTRIGRSIAVFAIVTTLFFSTLTPPATAQVESSANPPGDQTAEIAVQADLYAYPALLMELTRQMATDVEVPTDTCAPTNQFAHVRNTDHIEVALMLVADS
ncbi:MAG: hypothetical protein F6K56_16200 [Moorea sp. SIO3G5]|nr:hypothetical protein [Moorena sp. SIO3G5]